MKTLQFFAVFCMISLTFCFGKEFVLPENSLLLPLKYTKKYHILKILLDKDEYVLIDFENGVPSQELKDKEFGNHSLDFSAATIDNNTLRYGKTKSIDFYDELSEGYESPPKWKELSVDAMDLPKVISTNCKNNHYKSIIKKYFTKYPTSSFELLNCTKLDLDNNGTDEVIFAARNYPIPPELKKLENPKEYFFLVGLRYLDSNTNELKTMEIIKSTIYQEIFSDLEYMHTNDVGIYIYRLSKESPSFILIKEFTSIPKSAGGDFLSCKRFVYLEDGIPKMSCFSSFPKDL